MGVHLDHNYSNKDKKAGRRVKDSKACDIPSSKGSKIAEHDREEARINILASECDFTSNK